MAIDEKFSRLSLMWTEEQINRLQNSIVMVVGYSSRFWLAPSFLRVVVTTVACEVVFLPLVWLWVLNVDERGYVLSILGKKLPILQRFAK